MATKAQGVSCYDKAAPDEPLFVLRAHDRLAPQIVLEWARTAFDIGVSAQKVADALNCVNDMRDWQEKNGMKVPD